MTLTLARPSLVQALLDQLRRSISLHRQAHVIGVAHAVSMLAARHGLNVENAMIAALLHDLYKEWPAERIRTEIERLGGSIADDDLELPATWHGLCAALVGREEMAIDSPEVFEAVTLHTTADAGMGPLARALFIADFAEPGRTGEGAPVILQTACRDLNEGFRAALLAKIRHMRVRGKRISQRAIRATQAYLPPEESEALAALQP